MWMTPAQIEVLLEQLSYQPGLGAAPGELLLEFLELLIQEDAAFLQHLETQLDKLEEQLLEQAEPQRFENQLHRCRRTLLKLSAYYAQLDELGDTLAANRNGLFSKKLCRGFELFSHRAGRLHSQTASLREYSLQLHQIYQSKIDLKQNRVMQFLTVVTTVFMPLTPHHRVVRHEFPAYTGVGRSLGLPGRDPGQLGHPPGGGAFLSKEEVVVDTQSFSKKSSQHQTSTGLSGACGGNRVTPSPSPLLGALSHIHSKTACRGASACRWHASYEPTEPAGETSPSAPAKKVRYRFCGT